MNYALFSQRGESWGLGNMVKTATEKEHVDPGARSALSNLNKH